jgi:hypothetical protein
LQLWRRSAPAIGIDLTLARASTLIIALLVAHSFVDYPLRTAAVMAILAFSCGLLVAPPEGAVSQIFDQQRGKRSASARDRAKPRPATAPQRANAPISQHSPERWGTDIEWPEEWR